MASIENSLKYESEVEPGKVRLITSGEFVRAYNHSAWLFYCLRFYPDMLMIKKQLQNFPNLAGKIQAKTCGGVL